MQGTKTVLKGTRVKIQGIPFFVEENTPVSGSEYSFNEADERQRLAGVSSTFLEIQSEEEEKEDPATGIRILPKGTRINIEGISFFLKDDTRISGYEDTFKVVDKFQRSSGVFLILEEAQAETSVL